MAKMRSELRVNIMNVLYQIDILESNKLEVNVEEIIKNNVEIDNEFVKEVVFGVITYKNDIDELANKYMEDWTIERLDKIGASILRIGIFEIKYYDTPGIVAINEAIELAKKYCDEKVKNLINAVLDKIVKE